MEGPGISLFQGSDCLKITTNAQQEEEEELLKDERRRKEELDHLFENAFHDLEHDGDSSSDSSQYENQDDLGDRSGKVQAGDYSSYVRPTANGFHRVVERFTHEDKPVSPAYRQDVSRMKGNQNDNSSLSEYSFRPSHEDDDSTNSYNHSDSYSLEQLKVLYAVRLRELEKLSSSLEAEKESKKQILKTLTCLDAEKENALALCAEKQAVLDAREERLSELEQLTLDLKKTILNLEKDNKEANREATVAKEQIHNLKRTIETIERCDANSNREKQLQALLDSVNMKYQKEIHLHQQKFDALLAKYTQKEEDYCALENKLDALQRKHSEMLINKCDISARQDSTWQVLLDESNKEKIDLHKELLKVQRDRDLLRDEIQRYESITKNFSLSSSDENEIDSIYVPSKSRGDESGRVSSQNLNSKLKDELYKAIIAQRSKRQEIKKLQEKLRSMELQIHEMKERERTYLSEADQLKNEIMRLRDVQKRKLPEQSNELALTAQKQIESLTEDKQNLLRQIKQLESELEEVTEKYVEILSKNEDNEEQDVGNGNIQYKIPFEDQKLRDEFDKQSKDFNDLKQMYAEMRMEREKLRQLLEDELQSSSEYTKEINGLRVKLIEKEGQLTLVETSLECLKKENQSLTEKINTKASDSGVLKSLKEECALLRSKMADLEKANFVEVSTLKDELNTAKSQVSEFQAQMRNIEVGNGAETVKLDASVMTDPVQHEITSLSFDDDLEAKFKYRLETELKELESELRSRHSVELAATEERVKNATIKYFTDEFRKLENKHKSDFQLYIEKEQVVIEELKNALLQKQNEVMLLKQKSAQDYNDKLDMLEKQMEADRKRATEMMSSWIKEVQQMKAEMTEKDHEVTALKVKLNSARKAAKVYKKRSRENDLKFDQKYQAILVEIQSRVGQIVDEKETEVRENLRRIELEYEAREAELRKQFSNSLKAL